MRALSYSGDGFAKLKTAVMDNEDSRPLTPKQARAILADLASERQAREEAERERDIADGARAEAQSEVLRLSQERDEARRQLRAVVVMDLGYDHAPWHGHDPLRHQFAWKFAVADMSTTDIEADIARMREQQAREGETSLRADLAAAREKIRVDDELLAERNRLLDLFDCPAHGKGCVPHAIEEVGRLREALRNCRATAARQLAYKSRQTEKAQREAWVHIIGFCKDGGVESSVLRGESPAPSPRRSIHEEMGLSGNMIVCSGRKPGEGESPAPKDSEEGSKS